MTKGRLVLEDGTSFEGELFGAEKDVTGEVVFNTGMVGYPESMTDPSYAGQILAFTNPMVGNYGVPPLDMVDGMLRYFESGRIQVSAIIVSQYVEEYSHWNAAQSLGSWMRAQGIPGISGIDTRRLTIHLRSKGVMLGRIEASKQLPFADPNKRNLVAEVSTKEVVTYNPGKKRKIVLVDCGVKNNIIRSLVSRNLTVKRVPWNHPLDNEPADGYFLTNGPGDPRMCVETIRNIAAVLKKDKPIFGICLGNQLLSLALGGRTYKLKFGHRSQNQPAIDKRTGRCYITSQNHGFAVDDKKLPKGYQAWFVNANDGTNEGIRHVSKPIYSVQFHPEATPGPTDTNWLFDKFVEDLK